VTLSGKTGKGEHVDFSGHLSLSLDGSPSAAAKAAQIKSARMDGELKVTGQRGAAISKLFDRP
jgi:hypothetical protein